MAEVENFGCPTKSLQKNGVEQVTLPDSYNYPDDLEDPIDMEE